MTRKVIAKACKGAEYLFSKHSVHAVPASSAQRIADALNGAKFRLKDGEVWHVYDYDPFLHEYAEFQKFYINRGRLFYSES